MSFTVLDVEQRSPAWFAARLGRVTGSCVGDVLKVRQKGHGELAARIQLRRRLVAERLTGLCLDELAFQSFDVQRGIALEPMAFAAYEAATGLVAHRVGFVQHTELMLGTSPDARIGAAFVGGLELKAPKANTHVEYWEGGVIPEEYLGQCQMGLFLTEAEWWDFCSYHPDFPPELELFRVRLHRADFDRAAFELTNRLFLNSVDALVEALKLKAGIGVAA